jgi:hypothetical protein
LVRSGDGELRHEVPGGLGRMDILLTYKRKKYIIEIKVNRYEDIDEILNEGITQLSGKYLATEAVDEGYLVIFDTRVPVGTGFKPQVHKVKNGTITSFKISIGRPK